MSPHSAAHLFFISSVAPLHNKAPLLTCAKSWEALLTPLTPCPLPLLLDLQPGSRGLPLPGIVSPRWLNSALNSLNQVNTRVLWSSSAIVESCCWINIPLVCKPKQGGANYILSLPELPGNLLMDWNLLSESKAVFEGVMLSSWMELLILFSFCLDVCYRDASPVKRPHAALWWLRRGLDSYAPTHAFTCI